MRIHRAVQLTLFFLLFIAFFASTGEVYGITSDDIAWKRIATKHTIIHYKSLKDLTKFNKSIDYGEKQPITNNLFLPLNSEKLINTITKKVDNIYERVQNILDMNRKVKNARINLYSNKKDLNNAYFEIYNQPCKIRAWYIYKSNTIYMNVDDLHEGILAHEIAHSVIDHYLLISPPAVSAEILARYVDSHLHDKPTDKSASQNSNHTAYSNSVSDNKNPYKSD